MFWYFMFYIKVLLLLLWNCILRIILLWNVIIPLSNIERSTSSSYRIQYILYLANLTLHLTVDSKLIIYPIFGILNGIVYTVLSRISIVKGGYIPVFVQELVTNGNQHWKLNRRNVFFFVPQLTYFFKFKIFLSTNKMILCVSALVMLGRKS